MNVTGATAANKTYDALLGAAISGGAISAISGDDVTLATSGRTGIFADKNVANGKTVTVTAPMWPESLEHSQTALAWLVLPPALQSSR